AVAVVIDCPAGRIVHTGDFKFDFSPADQRPADFQEIATVGKKGVMVLVSDSTNSLEPGQTTSEKVIAENLDDIIRKATGRLIITSFSSLIGRLQQIMDSSMKYRRKIFLSGRSMATNIKIAQQLGYIKVPRGVIIDIRDLKRFPDDEIIILTTGSQGEDISALARMAMDTHLQVKIGKGDTVVLSSSPIIGNEGAINKVINNLCQRGAKVITNNEIDVHTSGHAKQEDLKLMIKLISPKYMIPAHGDLYMRMAHRDLAVLCDVPEKNVFLLDNGAVVEGDTNGEYQKTKEKVPAEYIMVEGPEKSQVEGSVLMDRHLMSENGVLIVTLVISKATGLLSQKPEVVSRGFVFMDTSKQVSEKVVQEVEKSFQQFIQKPTGNSGDKRKDLEHHIHHSLDRFLVRLLDKRPMVMPVVIVQ
ncbi:MAG: RNA-metabolising metallo-beta-lactamase, partial [Candidatus Peregrinibacteria bacterium GW2011_GWA2_44_7]